MTRTKFINCRFFEESTLEIEERLRDFLKGFRKRKLARDLLGDDVRPPEFGGPDLDTFGDDLMRGVNLNSDDYRTIRRRAALLTERRSAVSGLGHLKTDEVKRLSVLKGGVDLIPPGNEAWADELAATLHAEMPWMASATEAAWHALRRAAQRGEPALYLRPLLLNGPAGIGKSVWARRLAELCAVPSCVIEVGSGSAGFRVAGLERGWSSAGPGRPLETVLEHRIANPVIIVDEICKAQTVRSDKGQSHAFSDTLLALLEPASNKAWECPYYRVRFDMSHLTWVLTANDAWKVPVPLLNRCQIVDLPPIGLQDLCDFVRAEAKRRGLSEDSAEAIVIALGRPEARGKYISLRGVIRMLEKAEALEGQPRVH